MIVQLGPKASRFCLPDTTQHRRENHVQNSPQSAPCRETQTRNKTYDIRDGVLKGFGLRVLPSGRKHYFVHTQHHRQRIWKHIADAGAITEPEARARATSVLASIRNVERGIDVLPEQIVFERVAEDVFQRYQRHWKPATLEVNRSYYRKQILPWFKSRPIADITRHDVQQCFASLSQRRSRPTAPRPCFPSS